MNNILHEPSILQAEYQEYLSLVKYYQNVARTGIFVKYYNINIENSISDSELSTTYDYYTVSHITFDIYDLTPIYMIQEVNNRSEEVQDTKGSIMSGTSSVAIYTLERPKINDLLCFYPPIMSGELFRIINLTTPVNALHSTEHLNLYQLELAYAPKISTSNLKVNKEYVYDLSDELYYEKPIYYERINALQRQSNICNDISDFYNCKYDLYKTSDNKIPIITNELLIYHKSLYESKFKRLFTYLCPFGYYDIIHTKFYNSLNDYPFSKNIEPRDTRFLIYDQIDSKIKHYDWDYNNKITEMDQLLSLTRDLYNEIRSFDNGKK